MCVANKDMRVVIRTKFHHTLLMRYLSQLEAKFIAEGKYRPTQKIFIRHTRLAVRQFRVCLQHVCTYEVRFYLDCRELYTTSPSTASPQSLRFVCTSRNTVNLLIVLWATININYIIIFMTMTQDGQEGTCGTNRPSTCN